MYLAPIDEARVTYSVGATPTNLGTLLETSSANLCVASLDFFPYTAALNTAGISSDIAALYTPAYVLFHTCAINTGGDNNVGFNTATVSANLAYTASTYVWIPAAFVGISVALWGGEGWESADDWAALVAAGVIAMNGGLLLRSAFRDLMDRMPEGPLVDEITQVATDTACHFTRFRPGALGVRQLTEAPRGPEGALRARGHVVRQRGHEQGRGRNVQTRRMECSKWHSL